MARPKSNRKITRVSITLDDRDYKALRALADQNDVSTAWMVRRAVADFLEQPKKDVRPAAVVAASR
ncbi:ribbon-helix-helix protein, CopG family [Rhodobacterales bacterium HKCCE2091]|nr:ribbon-helix-helix protein, CopG family [Rhodobacterales bacterium HKCCE2091]